jgi:predicted Zn-dependent protease with MMP-like domain
MRITVEYTGVHANGDHDPITGISFDTPSDDLTCYEFLGVCERMALSLGYRPDSIAQYYGDKQ